MKSLIVILSVLSFSIYSAASSETLTPTLDSVDIAAVETVVTVGKGEKNGTEYLHKIIVVDHGLSTDVSPRYEVFYAYKMVSEMANPSVLYSLGYAFNYSNIRRVSAGVYAIDIDTYDFDLNQYVGKTLTVKVGKIQQEVEGQVEDFQDGPQGGVLTLTPLVLVTTSRM